MIRWHTRQLLVNISEELSAETLTQKLETGVKSAGGQIIASQADTYQGIPVVRLDIGLKEKVEGDEITIISDRVYLAKGKAAPIAPQNPGVKGSGQMAIVIDDFGYSKDPWT